MHEIRQATSSQDINACFPVMKQLRPHLVEGDFETTVRRQLEGGYRLVLLEAEGAIRAVAGIRILENLAGGRVLYVDDLVTDEGARSTGFGKLLFEWLVNEATEQGCRSLELDSGVQRFDAHRFYLTHRMHISSHHFRLSL